MTSERIVAADVSPDGTRRWELVQRGDGFFIYSEETFVSEDLREFGVDVQEYWTPSHLSGLFTKEEEARADALGQLKWLREIGSSKEV